VTPRHDIEADLSELTSRLASQKLRAERFKEEVAALTQRLAQERAAHERTRAHLGDLQRALALLDRR
jgi:uncharacterized coiled-coil protein SlyX